MTTKRSLLIFARAPEKGKVKTRLARELGRDLALDIYRGFVEKTVATAARAGLNTVVCYYPMGFKEMMQAWLGLNLAYLPQAGKDLGLRMAGCFKKIFQSGCRQAVLIGTDIPQIRPDHLSEAFLHLECHDTVIGPAKDGGYWLIGFNGCCFDPEFFNGIAWGSSTVFKESLGKMEKSGLSVAVLETLTDIDTLADLNSILPGIGGKPPVGKG